MIENTQFSSIVDINETNAQQVLIEQSQQQIVAAHFWSPRVPESEQQNQRLETLNQEYNGQFILAKVNVDDMMAIAEQLGVQGLPTLLLFQAGQPVDGAAGPQDEIALRSLLEKYLPKPWDIQLQQAQPMMAEGDFAAAMALLQSAYEGSGQRVDIAKALAHCFIERGRLDEANGILSEILLADQDHYYEQLQSQLQLKHEAADSPALKALEQQADAEPDNLEIKMQLAVQYHEQQQDRKACELLIAILQRDKNYDGCRKTLLDIFKALGNKDPLVTEFQRQLFSILY